MAQQIIPARPYMRENFPESTASSKNMKVLNVPVDATQVMYQHNIKYISRDGLLLYRIIDITAGCAIGAAGGWLIYHYHIKRFISRRLFLIRNSLKRSIRK